MFTVQGKRGSLRINGFTLLEIMLAVGILGLMSLAIFRFVQANMTALRLSSDTAARDSQYDGLRDLLTSEWQNLTSVRSKMYGEPFKLNERERDWIRWNSSAGAWTPDALRAGRLRSHAAVTTGKRQERPARPRFLAKTEGRSRCWRRARDMGAINQECDQSPDQLL